MAEHTLEGKLKLDISNFQKNLQKAREQFKEFTNQLAKIGAASAAALSGITAVLKKSADAYAEQERAVAKLNAALKAQGSYTEALSRDLQNFATQMQQVTIFGDEAIEEAMSMMATFGLTGEELKKATKAALDLASAYGMDLSTAAFLLGKAHEGVTDTLTRYGIILDENIDKNKKFEEVIKRINEKLGGQAEVVGNTLYGAMEKAKNAFGDLFETIGQMFAPEIRKVADFITNFSLAFQNLSQPSKDALKQLTLVGIQLLTLGSVFGMLALMIKGFGLTWSTIMALITNPWTLLVGLIALGAGIIITHWDEIKTALQPLYEKIVDIVDKIKEKMTEFQSGLKEGWKGTYDDLKSIWDNPDLSFLEKVGASIGLIASKIFNGDEAKGYEGLGTIWKKAWDKLVEVWQNPDLSMFDKIKATIAGVALAAWMSARTIGAALTDAFGGDVKQYLDSVDTALKNITTSWKNFKEGITTGDWSKAFSSFIDLAKELYNLPATFVLSGFKLAEDFDKTPLDNLANMIATVLGAKLMTGSWRIGLALALLADFVFGSEWTGNKWQDELIKAAESVGFSLLLFGTKLAIPIGISLYFMQDVVKGTGNRQAAMNAWRAWKEYMELGKTEVLEEWAKETGKIPITGFMFKPSEVQLANLAQQALEEFQKNFDNLSFFNKGFILGETFALGFYYGLQSWSTKINNYLENSFLGQWIDKILNNGKKAGGFVNKYPAGGGTETSKFGMYDEGGFTGIGSLDDIAGVVHRGEYVIPAWMVKKNPALVMALERIRKRGFQGGGGEGIDLNDAFAKSLDMFVNVMDELVNTFEPIVDIFNKLIEELSKLAEKYDFLQPLADLGKTVATSFDAMKGSVDALKELKQNMIDLKNAISEEGKQEEAAPASLLKRWQNWFDDLFQTGQVKWQEGFGEFFKFLLSKGYAFATNVIDTIDTVVVALNNVKSFIENFDFNAFVDNVKSGAKNFIEGFKNINWKNMLSNMGMGLLQGIGTIVSGVTYGLGMLVTSIIPVSDFFAGLSKALEPIANKLSKIFETVGYLVGQSLAPILEILIPILDHVAKGFMMIYNIAILPFIKLVASAYNALASAINAVFGWLGIRLELIRLQNIEPLSMEEYEARSEFESPEGAGRSSWSAGGSSTVYNYITYNITAHVVDDDGIKWLYNELKKYEARLEAGGS